MDHPALFAICAFLTLMVALSFIGYRLFYKPGKFLKQLGKPVITNERRVIMAESSSRTRAQTDGHLPAESRRRRFRPRKRTRQISRRP